MPRDYQPGEGCLTHSETHPCSADVIIIYTKLCVHATSDPYIDKIEQ